MGMVLGLIGYILLGVLLYSPFIFLDPQSRIGLLLRYYCGLFILIMPVYFLHANYSGESARGLKLSFLILLSIAWIMPFLKQVIDRKGMPIVETFLGAVIFFILYDSTNSFLLAVPVSMFIMGIVGKSTLKNYPILSK